MTAIPRSNHIVGISLTELGARCRNVWNFAQGLKFKADLHSKMSVCRHELGQRLNPPTPGNSNPASSSYLIIQGRHNTT